MVSAVTHRAGNDYRSQDPLRQGAIKFCPIAALGGFLEPQKQGRVENLFRYHGSVSYVAFCEKSVDRSLVFAKVYALYLGVQRCFSCLLREATRFSIRYL